MGESLDTHRTLLIGAYFDANFKITVYFSTSSIDSTAYFNVVVPKGGAINAKKGADVVWNQSDDQIFTFATLLSVAPRSQQDFYLKAVVNACIGWKN